MDIYFCDEGDIRLYPHDFVEYSFLVPNDRVPQNDIMDKFLNSPFFSVWASSIGFFAVFRLIFRKLSNHIENTSDSQNDLVYIVFDTIGLIFGTTSAHGIQSRAELVIVLFVSVFCLVAGIGCTGFLFEQLTVSNSVPVINSIAELLEHKELLIYRSNIVGIFVYLFPLNL